MSTDNVPLKEHILSLLDEKTRAIEAALAATVRASEKSERDVERWRANANEWRGSMNDREAKFVAKDVFDARIDTIEKQQQQYIGGQKVIVIILAIISTVSTLGAGLALLL